MTRSRWSKHPLIALVAAILVGCSPGLPASRLPTGSIGSLPNDQVVGKGHPLTLHVRMPVKNGGSTIQQLDPGRLTAVLATYRDPDLGFTATATASVLDGEAADLTLWVPSGTHRVIEVQGLAPTGAADVPFAKLKAVVSVPRDHDVAISWRTTPTANIVEGLRAAGSVLADTLDQEVLQSLVDRLIYGTPDGSPRTPYAVHPCLVDVGTIAAWIRQNGRLPDSLNGCTLAAATLTGHVTGMAAGETAQVVAEDPTSLPTVTDASGAFTLAGIAPGQPFRVLVTSRFYLASSSAPITLAPASQATVDLAMKGSYLPESSEWDQTNYVVRWTQLPIRLLIITPTGDHVAELSYQDAYRVAVNNAAAALEHTFPGDVQFEVTTVPDDTAGLNGLIRRSDIYLHWVKNQAECGGYYYPTAIGLCYFYPGNGTLPYDGASPIHCRSYQSKITIATHLDNGQLLATQGFQSVVCHELLHSLGISHSPYKESIMYMGGGGGYSMNSQISLVDVLTMRHLLSCPVVETRDHTLYDQVPLSQNPATISYTFTGY